MSSYLILAILSLLSPAILSAEWLDCGPSKSFVVELEDNKRVFIYDAEIKVKYERNDLAVYNYPGLAAVNVLVNNTAVFFEGHIVPENEELDPNAFKTSRVFNSMIAGYAKLSKSDNLLSNCNLYLSRSRNEEESNIPKKIQVEILHEAVTCAKSTLCKKLGAVTSDDIKRGQDHPFEFGKLSILSGAVEDENTKTTSYNSDAKPKVDIEDVKSLIAAYDKAETNSVERSGIQSVINRLVDLAVAEIVKKIEEENQGTFNIPDLNQNFTTGSSWWETTGEFITFDGTFEDLTTLRRTEDASLSKTGLKFIAACGFGLSRARVVYPKYKLRYGIIKVDGELSASVNGVALSGAVGVDYNKKPCQPVLQDLRVSNVGILKIKITGLGPLNKMLSKLVTWITKKWQDEIIEKVEIKLREIVVKNIDKLNCEKFRP